MKTKAFTLIELLVVIAIIAILAAILFPVFAQAKVAAKKSADLSQKKQLGTGIQIYISDYDDTFPLANTAVPNDPYGWNWGYWSNTPADWDSTVPSAYQIAGATFWVNAAQPYIKNKDMFASVGAPIVTPSWSTAGSQGAGKSLITTTVTMNGLLNAYSATAVNQISNTILLWDGKGFRGTKGYGFSNPYLVCNDANSPCVYQASTTCSSSAFSESVNGRQSNLEATGVGGTRVTAQGYGQGSNFIYTDTSAKFRKLGTGGGTVTSNPLVDPWATYRTTPVGAPDYTWWQTNAKCHPYLFRPDNDGTGASSAFSAAGKI